MPIEILSLMLDFDDFLSSPLYQGQKNKKIED
jgi:hypothetical protein